MQIQGVYDIRASTAAEPMRHCQAILYSAGIKKIVIIVYLSGRTWMAICIDVQYTPQFHE
jgi:hypothetical protein